MIIYLIISLELIITAIIWIQIKSKNYNLGIETRTMKSIASHSTVPSSHARNTQKWHNWEKNELKGKEV